LIDCLSFGLSEIIFRFGENFGGEGFGCFCSATVSETASDDAKVKADYFDLVKGAHHG